MDQAAHDSLVIFHRRRLAGSEFSVLCGTYIACNLWLHAASSDDVALHGQDVEMVYKVICDTMPQLRDMTDDAVRALAEAAVAELGNLGVHCNESAFACDCEDEHKPTVH